MAQINDAQFAALRTQEYTGALPDMLHAYKAANNITTWHDFYVSQGFTSGHISDFALTFWAGGGVPTP